MRKLTVFMCVAAAALWLAVPAFAGLTGTSHDITNAAGACANCHIPHGADAGRLWPAVPANPGGVTLVGDVAPLCGYCHLNGGGFGGGAEAWCATWAYGDLGHGVIMNGTNGAPRAHTDANAFPYMDTVGDAVIECTTCHNVHDDPASGAATSYRPFLRAPVGAICSQCHGGRRFENGVVVTANALGAWAVSARQGLNNPGSHPVGTDITGDRYRPGKSPITVPAIMNVSYAAGTVRDAWAMGGHLTGGATGGVTCATCHAVHGIRYDAADSGGITAADNVGPYGNMLAVGQAQNIADTLGGGSRSIYNGGGGFNALCEACHRAATVEIDTAYNSDTPAPNPGGTSWGHPVDDMEVQDATNWVSAFPTNWPAGALPAGSTADNTNLTNPMVICESCHVPHPAADAGRSDDSRSTFGSSDYILRDAATPICGNCHAFSVAGHHPVGITFDDPAGVGAGLGAEYLANVAEGVANQVLDCSTCHYGSGAHNWTAMGAVGLDPAWLPVDNGRFPGRAADQNDVNMSITCMDCHYGLTGAKRMSPTKNDGTAEGTPEYNLLGYGSHYIGNLGVRQTWSNHAAYWPSIGAPNRETTLWPAGGWSRFGSSGTGPILVCESCHELEPTKNTSSLALAASYERHLLLGSYIEGDMTDSVNDFCQGCHLPSGTHPLTNSTVTRPEPDRLLITNAGTLSWLSTPAMVDSNPTMGAAAGSSDIFNCDSCHQPHDAATNSLSFILDVDNTLLGGPTATSKLQGGNYTGYGYSYQAGRGGDHTTFCDVCHPYE